MSASCIFQTTQMMDSEQCNKMWNTSNYARRALFIYDCNSCKPKVS